MTGRTNVDVERCVRNRLYGERSDVTAARVARTAVPARAPAQLLGGRYRLLGLIGAGGMTNVYCTRDELLKRRVAVKILAEPLASDPASCVSSGAKQSSGRGSRTRSSSRSSTPAQSRARSS